MAELVIKILESTGYMGIVLLMFLENVFPPIPSEFIMPLAGFMAAKGTLSFPGTVLAGMAGSFLGTIPFYYLGRRVDEEKMKELADRYGRWLTVSGSDIEQAKKWFDRHGRKAVLIGRLVPGIRSLISIPAGISRMNFVPFAIYTLIGSSIWTLILAYSGFLLKSNFERVESYLNPISYIVFGVLSAIYIYRVIYCKPAK